MALLALFVYDSVCACARVQGCMSLLVYEHVYPYILPCKHIAKKTIDFTSEDAQWPAIERARPRGGPGGTPPRKRGSPAWWPVGKGGGRETGVG